MAADDTTPKTISQKYLTYILSAIKSFVPTNISELNNDKKYITNSDIFNTDGHLVFPSGAELWIENTSTSTTTTTTTSSSTSST